MATYPGDPPKFSDDPTVQRLADAFFAKLQAQIDVVARAMYKQECQLDDNIISWDEQTPLYKTRLRLLALAAIETLKK